MKKMLMIIIGVLVYFSCNAPVLDEVNLETRRDVIKNNNIKEKYNSFIKEFDRFLESLAIRESSNNWAIYNPYGYIGLYQIGYSARQDTGYGYITFSGFLENPNIFPIEKQRDAIIKLMKINYNRLYPYSSEYYLLYYGVDGTEINNVKLTLSGMIAGAHLGGAYGMRLFILTEGKYNPADINGTRISDYVEEFAGYNFGINLNFLI